jgi:DNA-binding beta-propeller fold protein YncE
VTELTSRFVYAADTTGKNVQGYLFDPSTNKLNPFAGPFPTFTSVNTAITDPQGSLLYVLGNGSITPAFISGFNGNVAASTDVLVQAGNWTSGAVDPTGHWLVALDSAGKTLQSFQITPIQVFGTPDGKLTAVGTPLATGLAAPSSVTFDPLGQFVFVSDGAAGTVTTYAFNESTGVVTTTGKVTTVSTTATAHVSIDASGTYLYAAVAGNGGSVPSGVAAYKINADGSLTAVAGSPFAAGTGTSGTSGVVVTSSVK